VQVAPPFTERTKPLRDQSGFAADITGAPRSEIPLAQTLQPVQARPDLTGTTLRQITDVVQNLPQRPVEIQLSPEELGRLRLAITGGEQALMVHVTAERPETMDLLRRHLDALHQEIRDLGFENISFSFAGERGAEQPADAETTQKAQAAAAEENPQVHPQIPPPPDPRAGGYRPGGLDLRV
jgi:flagellar hook-length control protein FliK